MTDLCERLRNDQRTRVTYIDRAEGIEQELNLRALCAHLTDLGSRDTFPFEERTFFAQAVAALQRDDPDAVRAIIQRHAHSVWIGKGESQAQWGLIEAAAHLVEACADYERQLPSHAQTQEKLIDFYLGSLRETDRRHRELEQAVSDHLDGDPTLDAVIGQARARYRGLAEKIQVVFTKHLEGAGWPPAGRLANAEVFDDLVAPRLQESGRRVAYLLIDALRYELGVALQQQLAEDAPVELQAGLRVAAEHHPRGHGQPAARRGQGADADPERRQPGATAGRPGRGECQSAPGAAAQEVRRPLRGAGAQ